MYGSEVTGIGLAHLVMFLIIFMSIWRYFDTRR